MTNYRGRLNRIEQRIGKPRITVSERDPMDAAFPGVTGRAQIDPQAGAFPDAQMKPDHDAWDREVEDEMNEVQP